MLDITEILVSRFNQMKQLQTLMFPSLHWYDLAEKKKTFLSKYYILKANDI